MREGPNTKVPGNTTHLYLTYPQGKVVSLTQTIMSAFGSSIMLSDSGILMANRMMWFDPLPGRTNSVHAGKRPLSNMFPMIPQAQDGSHTAIATCAGRKIFPAVFQLATFGSDYDITIDEAIRHYRLDMSGTDQVSVMAHTEETVMRKIVHKFSGSSSDPVV